VVYSFANETSVSALNFRINPRPSKGTIETVFQVTCINGEIKDQNSIGQVISSISQKFNQISNENLYKAMKSNI